MRSTNVIAMAFTLIAICLGSANADSAKTSLTGELADRFNAISQRLVCQCNCKMILSVCNHQNCPSGIPMRQEIEAKLQQGLIDDAIVEGFVARMGRVVLSEPPAKGGFLIAWILPFAVLAGGGFLVMRWLRRHKEPAGAAPPAAPVLSDAQEEKFQKEWEKWSGADKPAGKRAGRVPPPKELGQWDPPSH